MSGWHCPTCGKINNTADERGNCRCEQDRLVGMLQRITASDERNSSVRLRNTSIQPKMEFTSLNVDVEIEPISFDLDLDRETTE